MRNWSDLTIHEKINVKGNRLTYRRSQFGHTMKLRYVMEKWWLYLPTHLEELIQKKTNHFDPTPNETKY